MIRLILGAVLAAVVLFAWGFVFWAGSGVMYQFMHRLDNEEEVALALQKTDPASGTYLIPFPDRAAMDGSDKDKTAALKARQLKGPVVEIIYRKEGLDPLSSQEMVMGFCQFLAASLLAGVLLVMRSPACRATWCACCSSPWPASSRPWRSSSAGRSGSTIRGRRCCTRRATQAVGWLAGGTGDGTGDPAVKPAPPKPGAVATGTRRRADGSGRQPARSAAESLTPRFS